MNSNSPAKSLPAWLSHYLESPEIKEIRAAVAQAERLTSAEIVPMVVRSSVATDHVAVEVFLFTFALTLLAGNVLESFGLYYWFVSLGGASFVLASLSLFVAHRPFFIRFFTSRHDLNHAVVQRAHLEFYEAEISHTMGGTGVLLLISLVERRAVVLADKKISERLPQHIWDQTISQLLGHIRRGQMALGLKTTIGQIGEILREQFPREASDVNEICNDLIIKD